MLSCSLVAASFVVAQDRSSSNVFSGSSPSTGDFASHPPSSEQPREPLLSASTGAGAGGADAAAGGAAAGDTKVSAAGVAAVVASATTAAAAGAGLLGLSLSAPPLTGGLGAAAALPIARAASDPLGSGGTSARPFSDIRLKELACVAAESKLAAVPAQLSDEQLAQQHQLAEIAQVRLFS
jgi:hypothetical protein